MAATAAGGRAALPPRRAAHPGGPRAVARVGRPAAPAAAGGAAGGGRTPGPAAPPEGGSTARGRDVAGWTRATRGGMSASWAARAWAVGVRAHSVTGLRVCAEGLGAAAASARAGRGLPGEVCPRVGRPGQGRWGYGPFP